VSQVQQNVPGVRVDFDPILASPAFIASPHGFLTGSNGVGLAVTRQFIDAMPAADPDRATKAFLNEHVTLFGHGAEVLAAARRTREFVTPHNGLRTVIWEQELGGIPVFEGLLVSHTTRRGELVSISSRFVPDVRKAADAGMPGWLQVQASPPITAAEAIARAAASVGEEMNAAEAKPAAGGSDQRLHYEAPVLLGDTQVSQVWLPVGRSSLRLSWEVVLTSRKRGEMFQLVVDAETGEILVRHGLTEYYSNATYRVYTSDSPSPYSPGCATPCTTQPPLVARDLVTLSALSSNDSPAGWMSDGQNTTIGNNVDSHLDKNADNVPDPGSQPTGNPFRVFDFSMDLAQQPVAYTNAVVVQLFYWCNWMHDKLYELGFTEAAGNFQTDNFGRGGLGNDAVQADAQDGSGFNNANFSTPSDGSPGRMQMYIFNYPTPNRDGDLDAEVILHEYTHGLSNRRVGGGVGISALQSGGMGEGWSDFYALSLLSQTNDDPNATYANGGYVTYQLSGLTQNYYFGIRRYPYSTDMTKNPLTFKDIDPAQASAHAGVPRSPIIGTTANEVHNMGEVWCVTLWEARAKLIAKYGPAVGNQLMLQLVTDGMNLSPANPNFLQARDAILQADQVDTGGANGNQLWAAFAKRGMGFSATSPASSTTTGLVEAYDLPDFLKVTPGTGLSSGGGIGGPFSPASQAYGISNTGTSALNWTAGKTATWLDISSSSGSLTPGASNFVAITINSTANSLPAGVYSDTITFSNATSGMIQTRAVTLNVSPPHIYYFPLDTDPGWTRQGQWAFGKPTGNGGTSHGHPDPTTGATGTNVFGVNLSGDYVTTIGGPYYLTVGPLNFTGYTGTKLQFQRWLNTDYPPYVYATIDVSNDGVNWTQIFSNQSGVEIADSSWAKYQYDISAVADNHATVYVRWGHRVASSGAYAYSGWNIDDVEFLGSLPNRLTISMPSAATEGDPPTNGVVSVVPVPGTNLIVNLTSSDTTEITVPASVTILAGQSNATFTLTIVDDIELDGSQTATVTASASGYANGNANITVNDNETATLSVALPTSTIEGAGVVTGRVFASAAPTANVTVTLSSSDTTELVVPSSVTVAAGQTSIVFVATVVDDTAIDGPQNATVTAHVPGWTDGSATITVLDNENSNLTVVLPSQVAEGDGVITNGGSVSISGTLLSNVVVSLASSDTTELIVPASATIVAGQTSAAFNLTVVDDTAMDGPQPATVTASAAGFNNGSATTTVLDNDPHHFSFAPIASPQAWSVPFIVTITARDATNGTVAGFHGPVALSATGDKGVVSIAPTNSGVFTAGQWSGAVTANTLDSNVVLTASISGTGAATGSSNPFDLIRPAGSFFIPATNRVDMVPDATRGLLYITAGDRVLRYDLANLAFLTPYVFSGSSLKGIDISPDDNTLVVADSAYSSTSLWVYVVNLSSGTSQKAEFPLAFSEAGSWAVAFGNDGAVLITSAFQGSGWVPMRRFNPATGDVKTVASVDQNSMVSSSGDGHIIGVAEANSSGGPVDRYDVTGQAITGTSGTGWFNYEIGVNRDGTQFAVPTYGGTYIYDGNLQFLTKLGTYASEGPVGVSYYPQGDIVFFAWWPTSYVRAYETHTMAEVARYDTGHSFGNNGNWAFVDGRVRSSRDGGSVFVTVGNGVSWIFRGLGAAADLALNMADSPDPVGAGSNLTYSITASNIGPNAVADARVFDRLPTGETFVSATASQGACTLSNGVVTCTLGSLSSGGNATISIVVTSPIAAILTNTAAIYSSGADPNVTNNAATILTTVLGTASLAVTPATNLVATGINGGPFSPSSQTYTLTNSGTAVLNWSVTNTASWVSLSATSGTLPPFTATTITVSINSGANPLPAGNYNDTVSFINLNNGIGNTTRGVSLTVTSMGILSVTPFTGLAFSGFIGGPFSPASQLYSLTNSGYAALSWSASKSQNWLGLSATSGTLGAGEGTTVTVSINSSANTLAAGNYSDTIAFTNLTNGIGSGVRGVSLNVRPPLDHFSFSTIASQQMAAIPFAVTITAIDSTNGVFTDFTNSVALSGVSSNGIVSISPTNTGALSSGQWVGAVTISNLAANVQLVATDGSGHSGTSTPFNVVIGPLHHFALSPVTTTQYVANPFPLTITAKDAGNYTVVDFTNSVALSGWNNDPGQTQLITFDDLPDSGGIPVPADYSGMTWSNFYYMVRDSYGTNSGYYAGTVSPPNVAFNGWAAPVSIVNTGSFSLISAYLTAAWIDNLQVQVEGYVDTALTYSNTYPLSVTTPTLINFNYFGVTRVDLVYGGGGGSTHFAIDNVLLSTNATASVAISPTNTGNFVSGVWSGSVVALQAATNVFLQARDGAGHLGTSSQFVVEAGGLLGVTPSNGLSSAGIVGGPFSPSSQTYTVTNTGVSSLNWSVANTASWVSLSSTGGTLPPGGSTDVTVSITGNANSLDPGSYADAVVFTNIANGIGSTSRTVSLTANSPSWQQWQMQYFGCTNCPQAAATADPDGDGQDNAAEFLAGTDPTSSTSTFRITSIVRTGNDILVTWRTGGGRTNVLQAMSGPRGVYFNISPNIVIPDAGDAVTNYLDKGGATNSPCRFYRVALGGGSIQDTNPPTLAVTSPANNAYITNSTVTITGTSVDVSGVAGVTVNGNSASSTNGYSSWMAVVSGLSVGTNTLTVLAGDNAAPANIITNIIRVIYAVGDFDGNGDGLPDAWQIKWFGSVTVPGSGPNNDPDGDGLSNLQEYLAGTDPTSTTSALRITAVERIGADIRVSFTSVVGKSYRLERCNVVGGAWTNIVDNLPGSSSIQQATDIAGATRSAGFYRVSLVQTNGPAESDSDGDGIPDSWMLLHFGHATGQSADRSRATDDNDGDGLSNLQEFLAGTDPTNSASALRITGLTIIGNNVLINWTMGSGKTNALQIGTATGHNYSSNFVDCFTVTNTVGTATNYLDRGGATNSPARFYRVRLVP
jgi:hypothetical protein